MPVILWTDALIWLLVAALVAAGVYASGREHLRAPWRRVLYSRRALASMTVLAAFVAVGLLDSMHFHPRATGAGQPGRYSGEVISVLDWLAAPLREQVEKTYSAPFAVHLYSKETVELPGGGQARVYPRLRYGGAHLADTGRGHVADVVLRGVQGMLGGFALWAVLLGLAALARGAGRPGGPRAALAALLRPRKDGIPWFALSYTLLVLLLLSGAVLLWAGHYHILGTDKVGQDVFFQSLKSIRTGLVIGTLTTLVTLPLGIGLGVLAGYFRGWVDDLIQYLYTTLNSIPGVLLIAASVLMLQVYMGNHPQMFDTVEARADLRLLFLCIILGVTSWTGLCRLLRGETLKLRESDYVQAAIALGVARLRIIGRHILPNVMHIVLITVVLDFSSLVLAEAVLSYVGVGVDPSMSSWGNMINGARLEMAREPVVWWSLAAAFTFMFTLVLAANLFADAVRDAFDPRLRT